MNNKLTFRRILAFFARMISGKSTCKHCGMPHKFTQMHITWVGAIGLTALCETCFQELKPEDRLPFYKKLRTTWMGSGSADEVNWPLTKGAILAE